MSKLRNQKRKFLYYLKNCILFFIPTFFYRLKIESIISNKWSKGYGIWSTGQRQQREFLHDGPPTSWRLVFSISAGIQVVGGLLSMVGCGERRAAEMGLARRGCPAKAQIHLGGTTGSNFLHRWGSRTVEVLEVLASWQTWTATLLRAQTLATN